MEFEISRAAVIGAGWMGASIAALFASAGIDTVMLDVLPPMEPSEEDLRKGLTRFSKEWRSSLAIKAIESAKARDAFLDPDAISRITFGNMVDDIGLLSKVDWVLEAVPEVLDVKRATYERIASHIRPETLVSSNTSGLLVSDLLKGAPDSFTANFFVSHFFNPVRHMRLMELVPSTFTDSLRVNEVVDFARRRLGKGVIISKDTPYFVANRIGLFSLIATMAISQEMGVSVEECDKLTGKVMARAGSGTFRTADIIGLDSMLQVFDNLHGSLAGDPYREYFNAPAFFRIMVEKGLWGDKKEGGFYRRSLKGNGEAEVISLDTFEYGAPEGMILANLQQATAIHDPRERLKFLVSDQCEGSSFAWRVLRDTMAYSAYLLGKIVDEPINIDRALRWGYNWELGPFEIWDALGVDYVVDRMARDGLEPPETVQQLLKSDSKSWYGIHKNNRQQFLPIENSFSDVPALKGEIDLPALNRKGKQVFNKGNTTLTDIGDGVACMSFNIIHFGKSNSEESAIDVIRHMLEEINRDRFKGLVLSSQAPDFSVGMNLVLLGSMCDAGKWEALEALVREYQELCLELKRCSTPVVAAIAGRAYGIGFELAMHCGRIQAHVESSFCMNEIRNGLVPTGGGCKEMLYRAMDKVSADGPHPLAQYVFDIMLGAKLAKGVFRARQLGFMRKVDSFSMGRESLLADAKNTILDLLASGYGTPPILTVNLPGEGGHAALGMQLEQMHKRGELSDHDVVIGDKLAHILTGGDCSPVERISEERLLELEREAFLSLCGMEKTLERIRHRIRTGRPLRN